MTRRYGWWAAACVGLAVVAVAVILLWASCDWPHIVAHPEPTKELPPEAARPEPEPLPDGVIRGVTGYRHGGGL